jgi:predicted DNA binding CopG/RHH family protein
MSAKERALCRRNLSRSPNSLYFDLSKAVPLRFPNLKPSTTAISLRLPVSLLEQVKIAANKGDVPYQSLIKMWLAEKVG